MTENEAKILIERTLPKGNSAIDIQLRGALEIVIKALEEIQQYREMEEKLNGISVKEVINGFIATVEKETCEEYNHGRILTNEDADKWKEYKSIGTVEEFKRLKETFDESLYKQPTYSKIKEDSQNATIDELTKEIKEKSSDILIWLMERQEAGYGTSNGELHDKWLSKIDEIAKQMKENK